MKFNRHALFKEHFEQTGCQDMHQLSKKTTKNSLQIKTIFSTKHMAPKVLLQIYISDKMINLQIPDSADNFDS